MKIIDTNIEEFNTSEAYFGHILFGQCNLVIPYISIEISSHFINPLKKSKYINKAYCVFEGVSSLNIDFSKNNVERLEDYYDLCRAVNDVTEFYVGGNSTYKETDTEMTVRAQKRYVLLLNETKGVLK